MGELSIFLFPFFLHVISCHNPHVHQDEANYLLHLAMVLKALDNLSDAENAMQEFSLSCRRIR